MLEFRRTPHADGTVELSVKVPRDQADAIQAAFVRILAQRGPGGEDPGTAERVRPEVTPGKVLRGARGLAGLTQARLSERLGIHKSNLSEMERDRRAIGKDMARRLGKELGMDYKVFL